MAIDDFSALFADDEPTAQERAAAMTDALRRQRAAGMLGLLTGDKVLGGFGSAQVRGADQQEQMIVGAAQQRSGQRLQKAMQAGSQQFQGRENALNRSATRSNLEFEVGARSAIEAQKAAAERAAAAAKSAGDLRKELQGRPEFKAFQEVSTAFDKVQRAAKGKTAASDMSMIFGYMKLLDPGSTVREGEYANAQQATGVPGYILNLYNKAKDGQLLNDAQRADFLSQAHNLLGAHQSKFDALAGQYRGLAEKSGASPGDVVLEAASPGGLSPEEAAELKRLEQKYGGGK